MIDSYGGLILVLGKCSIPFLKGNWNFMFPSFISITTPMVRKNGLPRIIGQDGLKFISRTIKYMGTKLLLARIRTLLIHPIGFLMVESAK
jgi:hypothetical protein